MENLTKIFVGVDVSKKNLDVYFHPNANRLQVENSPKGINEFVKKLSSLRVEIVIFEASGGYELLLKKSLDKAQIKNWRVNPSRVVAFRESEGIRAKSDTSDARVLALFGAEKKCNYEPYKYSDQETLLRDLVQRRSDLVKMSIAEKARLSSPEGLNYKSSIKRVMKFLEKEIARIDEEIIQAKKPLEKFAHQEKLLLSIPGVGQVTATTLLATAPELGKIENKQASALIGVAPYTRKSGTFKGKEFIQGGRPVPRRVLYMASLTAVRHNPKLKDFYQKLIKAGKRAKVALVAAMRKLICIINAMLRKDEMWNSALP